MSASGRGRDSRTRELADVEPTITRYDRVGLPVDLRVAVLDQPLVVEQGDAGLLKHAPESTPELRILTVRQPWAWAIVHGGKDVENRVLNVAGSYRGPIAIHAGLREDTAARSHPEIIRLVSERYWTEPANLLTGRRDQFGHIIGVVDLVDVHDCWNTGLGQWCCASPWAERDAFAVHLRLANPRPLATPIPFKGALGLRKLPDDVAAAVWAEVAS